MKKSIILLSLLFVAVSAIAGVRQTREEYVEKYKAIAIAHMERYGIPASITMAQGILVPERALIIEKSTTTPQLAP